jgi:hypothetical protein
MKQYGEDFKKYLQPTFFMDCEHPNIKEKAEELIEGIDEEDDIAKAIKLFYFVRDGVRYTVSDSYNFVDKETSKSSLTLERKFGFCIPKAILLASLARAVGIPSRLHYVDIINHMTSEKLIEQMGSNLFVFHGFTELFLNGKWVECNCAFDRELCERKNFPWVDFDGVKDGLFAATNKDGEPFVDYIKDHGVFDDCPHELILKTWAESYDQSSYGDKIKQK